MSAAKTKKDRVGGHSNAGRPARLPLDPSRVFPIVIDAVAAYLPPSGADDVEVRGRQRAELFHPLRLERGEDHPTLPDVLGQHVVHPEGRSHT